jgi:hypothetical protein
MRSSVPFAFVIIIWMLLIPAAVVSECIKDGIYSRQAAFETDLLNQLQAEEFITGETYSLLQETASTFGRPTPYLFLAHNPEYQNARYIAGSVFTYNTNRGRIIMSERYWNYPIQAKRGLFAHEIQHLCDEISNIKDPAGYLAVLQHEADVDRRASTKVGKVPLQALFYSILDSAPPHLETYPEPYQKQWKDCRQEIMQRLAALDKSDK